MNTISSLLRHHRPHSPSPRQEETPEYSPVNPKQANYIKHARPFFGILARIGDQLRPHSVFLSHRVFFLFSWKSLRKHSALHGPHMSHGQNKQRSSKKHSAKTGRKWLKMAKHCKTKQPIGPLQKRYLLSFTLGSCSRFWWRLMISLIFAGVLIIRCISMPCMSHVCMCGWTLQGRVQYVCNIETSSLSLTIIIVIIGIIVHFWQIKQGR